jgi:hypothetical protein
MLCIFNLVSCVSQTTSRRLVHRTPAGESPVVRICLSERGVHGLLKCYSTFGSSLLRPVFEGAGVVRGGWGVII